MHTKRTGWRRFGRLGVSLAIAAAAIASTAGLAALTEAPAGAATPVTTYFTFGTPLLGGWTQQAVTVTGSAPATATQGSNFTLGVTPSPEAVPTTDSGIAVTDISDIQTLVPIPAGATYVSSSVSGTGSWTGGTAASLPASGTFTLTATYCTATTGTLCTATPQNLTAASGASAAPYPFAGNTTLPYIQVSTGTTPIPAGATVTFPEIDTVLTASGAVGTALPGEISEFDSTATVTLLGSNISIEVHGWPTGTTALPASDLTSTSPIPAATAVPFSTTTITSPTTVPGAPTIGTATAGNASATVTWTAPASNGGSAITGYVITPSSGSPVTVGNVTSDDVTGLTNGTAYTFTVAAINSVGTGPASAASNSVTPTAPATVPGAPSIGTATAGNASATVTWTAPASNGGSAITGYVITPSSGSAVTVGNVTSDDVTGLTNGTAYTFTVAAINAVGTGPASAASNSVTPPPRRRCLVLRPSAPPRPATPRPPSPGRLRPPTVAPPSPATSSPRRAALPSPSAT